MISSHASLTTVNTCATTDYTSPSKNNENASGLVVKKLGRRTSTRDQQVVSSTPGRGHGGLLG